MINRSFRWRACVEFSFVFDVCFASDRYVAFLSGYVCFWHRNRISAHPAQTYISWRTELKWKIFNFENLNWSKKVIHLIFFLDVSAVLHVLYWGKNLVSDCTAPVPWLDKRNCRRIYGPGPKFFPRRRNLPTRDWPLESPTCRSVGWFS